MDSSNNYKTMSPNFKERYGRLKKVLKAKSEEEASKDPKKFMDKMKNPSIKKMKGIAF